MLKLADSCGVIAVSKLRRSGVNVVGSLFISSPVYPQVVFTRPPWVQTRQLHPVCTSLQHSFVHSAFLVLTD